jgi:hypothetical protein
MGLRLYVLDPAHAGLAERGLQHMKVSFVVGPDDVRIEVVQPKA